jgi:rRNA maturation endonuclease Nob1
MTNDLTGNDEGARDNLKKYYDIIKVCILCKKEFGVDKGYNKKKKENNICPVCQHKLTKETTSNNKKSKQPKK